MLRTARPRCADACAQVTKVLAAWVQAQLKAMNKFGTALQREEYKRIDIAPSAPST